MPKIII